MIARLRRRHQWTVALLAIVVPAVFFWAMLVRRSMPTVENAPGASANQPETRP